MESSFFSTLAQLQFVDAVGLLLAGCFAIYCVLSKQIHYLMFILVLSAALVGSTIPVLGTVAPVARWLVILLLFIFGILQGRLEIHIGFLFFFGYIILGFIFLPRALVVDYQLQRAVLLLIVAITIPFLYSGKDYKFIDLSLQATALAASLYCLVNVTQISSSFNEPTRYSGLAKGAATFAVYLGGVLPFTLWGVWKTKGWMRIICLLGFVFGTITLINSGQRTGTFSGLISLLPLIFLMQKPKYIGWSLLVAIILFGVGYLVFKNMDSARIDFILARYNNETGLSGRDEIWKLAFSEIYKNPVLGRGIGASEWIYSGSFHNAYLEVWFNTGFLGLLFFIISQLTFFYKSISLGFKYKSADARALFGLSLGFMLGFVVSSSFEAAGSGASSINIILYLFLAFLVSKQNIFASQVQPVEPAQMVQPDPTPEITYF